MFNMYKTQLNRACMASDASFAPACSAVHENMLSLREGTAMLAVSFLHIMMAVVCGLVRIMTPEMAKPMYFHSLQ